jgi:hypothetical protein
VADRRGEARRVDRPIVAPISGATNLVRLDWQRSPPAAIFDRGHSKGGEIDEVS